MIKNRLAIIMAEKGISSVSELERLIKEKGFSISYKSLNKFYKNENSNVAYETLEILTEVLDVELGELLVRSKQ